jgi:uncharacterized phage-like protein YoqJ
MRVTSEREGKICCFTGHRKIDVESMQILSILLDKALSSLLANGVTVFRAGGAVGFDTLAALKVIELRAKDPNIRLDLFLPCREQADKWDERSREYYSYIISKADNVIYVRENYVNGCMLERNRRMVEGSDFCIGFCTSKKGGSAYTLNYAKKKNVRVINLATML